MPKPGTLAYECRTAFVSTCLQIVVALACVLLSLWIASLLLEWLNLLGITTVPPGIRYADYRHPPFIPAGDSVSPTAARMELLRQGVEVGDIDLGASAQEQLTDYREATGAPTRRRLLPRFAAL
jgi:hypothetical protein